MQLLQPPLSLSLLFLPKELLANSECCSASRIHKQQTTERITPYQICLQQPFPSSFLPLYPVRSFGLAFLPLASFCHIPTDPSFVLQPVCFTRLIYFLQITHNIDSRASSTFHYFCLYPHTSIYSFLGFRFSR